MKKQILAMGLAAVLGVTTAVAQDDPFGELRQNTPVPAVATAVAPPPDGVQGRNAGPAAPYGYYPGNSWQYQNYSPQRGYQYEALRVRFEAARQGIINLRRYYDRRSQMWLVLDGNEEMGNRLWKNYRSYTGQQTQWELEVWVSQWENYFRSSGYYYSGNTWTTGNYNNGYYNNGSYDPYANGGGWNLQVGVSTGWGYNTGGYNNNSYYYPRQQYPYTTYDPSCYNYNYSDYGRWDTSRNWYYGQGNNGNWCGTVYPRNTGYYSGSYYGYGNAQPFMHGLGIATGVTDIVRGSRSHNDLQTAGGVLGTLGNIFGAISDVRR